MVFSLHPEPVHANGLYSMKANNCIYISCSDAFGSCVLKLQDGDQTEKQPMFAEGTTGTHFLYIPA